MRLTSIQPTRQEIITRGGIDNATQMALRDLIEGTARWRLWGRLGWNDILQRYRRSVLGPFWLTASQAVMVISLGLLYAELFKTDIHDFLPFLCIGLLIWGYISSFLNEAGTLFVGSESYIKQIKLPYTLYVYRSAWSKLIILAHNFVIYFGIMLYFQIWPGANALWALPGFALVTLNGALASLAVGMVSTRFRDIPQLVVSLTQIVFFITPIMWKPSLLENRTYIAFANPFYHLIEIVRAPLLGIAPATLSYVVVLVVTAINLAISGVLFIRFRARIAYWI